MLVYTDVGAMVGQGEGCQRRQKGKGTGKRERGRDGGHGQRRKRRLNCPMMYFFFLFFGRRRESSHEPIQRCTFSCNHRSTIFDFLIRFDNFCFYFFVAILFSLQSKVRFFFFANGHRLLKLFDDGDDFETFTSCKSLVVYKVAENIVDVKIAKVVKKKKKRIFHC